MILGLSSYSFAWALGIPAYDYIPPMSVFDLPGATASQGLNLLQIADNAPLHILDKYELKRIAEQGKEMDIDFEVGTKKLNEEHLARYIEIAEFFESDILRIVIDDSSAGYEPDLETVISILKNAVPLLEQKAISLAIENHDRIKVAEFEKIIQSVGSSRVGICLDCANSLGAGEGIFETVRVLAPYTLNLHLKDISIRRKKHMMGFDVEGVSFGKGMIPLPWIIEQMPLQCKTAILEFWVPPENDINATIEKELQWVNSSVAYILDVLKSV